MKKIFMYAYMFMAYAICQLFIGLQKVLHLFVKNWMLKVVGFIMFGLSIIIFFGEPERVNLMTIVGQKLILAPVMFLASSKLMGVFDKKPVRKHRAN